MKSLIISILSSFCFILMQEKAFKVYYPNGLEVRREGLNHIPPELLFQATDEVGIVTSRVKWIRVNSTTKTFMGGTIINLSSVEGNDGKLLIMIDTVLEDGKKVGVSGGTWKIALQVRSN